MAPTLSSSEKTGTQLKLLAGNRDSLPVPGSAEAAVGLSMKEPNPDSVESLSGRYKKTNLIRLGKHFGEKKDLQHDIGDELFHDPLDDTKADGKCDDGVATATPSFSDAEERQLTSSPSTSQTGDGACDTPDEKLCEQSSPDSSGASPEPQALSKAPAEVAAPDPPVWSQEGVNPFAAKLEQLEALSRARINSCQFGGRVSRYTTMPVFRTADVISGTSQPTATLWPTPQEILAAQSGTKNTQVPSYQPVCKTSSVAAAASAQWVEGKSAASNAGKGRASSGRHVVKSSNPPVVEDEDADPNPANRKHLGAFLPWYKRAFCCW